MHKTTHTIEVGLQELARVMDMTFRTKLLLREDLSAARLCMKGAKLNLSGWESRSKVVARRSIE